MAEIFSITVKKDRESGNEADPDFLRIPVRETSLVVGQGIQDDAKGKRHPDRQLNILSLAWVQRLDPLGYKTAPGAFGEQLIVSGLDVEELGSGERLKLGDDAIIEITKSRTGCERLEAAQYGLPLSGKKIGMLARVVQGGIIRVGDLVRRGDFGMGKYPQQRLEGVQIGVLAWLAGKWLGVVGKDPVEEYWTAPAAGSLLGMFRWLAGETVRFYEILVIEEEGGGLVMRIKHFDPGLKGWEEKEAAVIFDLVQVKEGEAVFSQRGLEKPQWLVYTLDAGHKLVAYFEKSGEPVTYEDKFRFTRLA